MIHTINDLSKPGKLLILIDSGVNYLLGVVLLAYSKPMVSFLGLPEVEHNFYPNILGAVLFGIGIALHIEYKRTDGLSGLGLAGAICINLMGGVVLLCWLMFGDLSIPIQGKILLWLLDVFLIAISILEYYFFKNAK